MQVEQNLMTLFRGPKTKNFAAVGRPAPLGQSTSGSFRQAATERRDLACLQQDTGTITCETVGGSLPSDVICLKEFDAACTRAKSGAMSAGLAQSPPSFSRGLST